MNNNEKFLQLYREFESWARDHFEGMGDRDMWYLENNYSLQPYANQLEFYRQVRNLLTHHGEVGNSKVYGMLHITAQMLNKFLKLKEEITRPIIDVAIKDVISRGLDDNVMDAVMDMNKRNYTHLPVLKDGKMIGLFSENTIFRIVSKGGYIDDKTSFRDIMEFIDIRKTKLVQYLKPDSNMPECRNKFSYAIDNKHRLDIVFITEDGTADSELLGLITIWDLPGMV